MATEPGLEKLSGVWTLWSPDSLKKTLAGMNSASIPFLEQFALLQQRNIDAMTAAAQAAIEGAQRVALRHKEMLERYMAMVAADSQAFADARTPEAKAALHAELMKRAYASVVADMRELSDLAQGANAQTLDVLHKRFAEAMEEITNLTNQAK